MAKPLRVLANKTKKIAYDANGNAEYVGEAEPGVAVTDAKWKIKKITYDANGNATDVKWADGTNTFTKVWNDKGDYTYS